MYNVKKYTKLMEQAEIDYYNTIDKIAKQALEECVKPYCLKNKLDFCAGNGTYLFSFVSERNIHYPYSSIITLPKTLQDIMEINCINSANGLGSLMPDFKYPE